ncbi:HpcH/HpaI aldolase/citrate lyase family protein [Arthrobacter russicus]|jgi:citrate lyase subunit beta/citryl-CoA lyase|uniref:Citrate lyase subunit beta/citryl-CoA lyase n=1 Tax=Arthrobacter russicus TaxID=172040 RepID=A0ABU1JD48_9MICC|nr:CoA ester lyase [Arthrobacter russicus]MBQ1444659.1 CoA ester lyase [Renibacterium sp.]MDN5667751.1 CoA ester lyase [Renibacterium salmoninarum]MDR6270356.1 citrate lyase subunit beta/citryl-CoA lyase [Arthrobacter russicus]
MSSATDAYGDTGLSDQAHPLTSPLPRIRNVPAEIARSWLLVPATQPETFDAAVASRADAVVLDIEDAVDPSHKSSARNDVIQWLRNGGEAWVRINDASSDFWADDVAGLRGTPGLQGVMLAKTESAAQVKETFHRLDGKTRVLALVESAVGIEEANNIARAEGAFRLAFGSGDFRRDTGMAADREAMAYPRAKLVVASRVGNLPGPIDGPTVGTNHPILREQSAITVAMGMTGKLCLQADQSTVINEVISPAPSDVAWATDFMADFNARGGVIRDGSDLPRLGRAEKIMKLAVAFGVQPAS